MKRFLSALTLFALPLLADEEAVFNTGQYKAAFVKTSLTFIAFIALILLTVWLIRRMGSGQMTKLNQTRHMKVLERRPLSPKSTLYLVEIGGKHVVLAESQLEVRPITTLDTSTQS
jgi:flagellar protein FliO/FliZ